MGIGRRALMRLADRVALITGAGSGIGRAAAILFSEEGAQVAVVDIDTKGGQETVDMITGNGGKAIFIEADVSKEEDAERMIGDCVGAFGKLDILYNNAGISLLPTPTEELPIDQWDKAMDINAKAIFLACRQAIPLMKKQGRGVIISTTSMSGVRPRPGAAAYAASKAAAIMFTKALAIELAPFGIRVNCVNPSPTDTPMAAMLATADANKAVLSTVPMGRFAKPIEIAYGALYLASDESAMVTGFDLNVDGGRGI
jgi:NAD(P)-dependent dehydrogenase (short-subunit alcohol dehydrogenase family)